MGECGVGEDKAKTSRLDGVVSRVRSIRDHMRIRWRHDLGISKWRTIENRHTTNELRGKGGAADADAWRRLSL